MTQDQLEKQCYKAGLMYLLYERENETQLRVAFSALAQERHNQFHTPASSKDGDGSVFEECSNLICKNSYAILQESREPKIELTPISTEMLEGYALNLKRSPSSAVISLVKEQSQPENLVLKI